MPKYGLLGKDLKHSFSKKIHEDISDIKYELINISEEEIDDFLLKKDFLGINVTIPYKEKVIPYLDEEDDIVKEIKVCNTIVNNNGKLYGYNTDFIGLCYLFDIFDIEVKNKNVIILGNGATAKTITYFLKKREAQNVVLLARNNKNNADLLQNYQKYLNFDIIINATPVGMYPNVDESLIKLDEFENLEAVVDVIYNPIKTDLLLQAEKLNIKNVNGLYMLVAQAVFANYFFNKRKIDLNIILIECRYLSYILTNIVLIGMPGSGKTTIGKQLAKKLNRKFIDIDEEIIKQEKMSIKDIFVQKGEEYFRNLEKEIIKKISLETNCVISTGGGSILSEENLFNLKRNGKIIHLVRDLDKIIIDDNRPLLKNKQQLQEIFSKRYDLYEKSCNIKVENDSSIEDVVIKVEENFYESFNH